MYILAFPRNSPQIRLPSVTLDLSHSYVFTTLTCVMPDHLMWVHNKTSGHISPSISYSTEGPPWVVIPFLNVYPLIHLHNHMIHLDWKFRIIFQVKLFGTGWLGATTFTCVRIWPAWQTLPFKNVLVSAWVILPTPSNILNIMTPLCQKNPKTQATEPCPCKLNNSTRTITAPRVLPNETKAQDQYENPSCSFCLTSSLSPGTV